MSEPLTDDKLTEIETLAREGCGELMRYEDDIALVAELRRLRAEVAKVSAERDEAEGANILNRNALKHARAVCEEIDNYCFTANQTVLDDKEPIRKDIRDMARKGVDGRWESQELNIKRAEMAAVGKAIGAVPEFDDWYEPSVVLDKATALVAERDTAIRERDEARANVSKQTEYSITLQRLIETLARGEMPVVDDVGAPHLSRKAVEAGKLLAEARARPALTDEEHYALRYLATYSRPVTAKYTEHGKLISLACAALVRVLDDAATLTPPPMAEEEQARDMYPNEPDPVAYFRARRDHGKQAATELSIATAVAALRRADPDNPERYLAPPPMVEDGPAAPAILHQTADEGSGPTTGAAPALTVPTLDRGYGPEPVSRSFVGPGYATAVSNCQSPAVMTVESREALAYIERAASAHLRAAAPSHQTCEGVPQQAWPPLQTWEALAVARMGNPHLPSLARALHGFRGRYRHENDHGDQEIYLLGVEGEATGESLAVTYHPDNGAEELAMVLTCAGLLRDLVLGAMPAAVAEDMRSRLGVAPSTPPAPRAVTADVESVTRRITAEYACNRNVYGFMNMVRAGFGLPDLTREEFAAERRALGETEEAAS